ncbi:MAG: pectate lyase [Bacteroides sp.]|nr:pectate lyase [Bacteroides sp.]
MPDSYKQKARIAFHKGVECILKTQIRRDGKLTAWCAQYDPVTLEPAKARAYELISLSGQESDNIVLFLMSLENPSQEIINAIEGAVAWFEKTKIEGIKKEYFANEEGKRDYRMVHCDDCPPSWARFYEIDTDTPFFCDRDGIKRYDLSEIGYERRNGYS